jgi:hypothetical protein
MQKQIILTISILFISRFLLGQSSCDSSAVFIIAEEPPLPNITYEQIEATLNNAITIDHFILPSSNLIKIRFIINCQGETFNYRMLSPLDTELFNKISQTLKATVSWTPAKQAHKNVDIWKTLTISSKNGKLKILGEKDLKGKSKISNISN